MSKTTSTRLGQILLDKGLITVEQLDLAIQEQQKRRQLLDPFDANLGVNSSLGEILIEMGFIDRLQLRRGLNWQLMLRKMAIVMSFCAPLMVANYAAASNSRPTFVVANSSSSAPKSNPTFTKASSSSSAPAVLVVDNDDASSSSSVDNTPEPTPISSVASTSSSSHASTIKSSSSSSSKASSVASSASKSSVAANPFSTIDTTAPKMPEKITVSAALYDQVKLSWTDAYDEAGVTRYKVYRDQVQIDTLNGDQTEYTDFNVAPGKTYLYGISAGDDAGNWSLIKSVFAQTSATPGAGGQASSAASNSSKATVTSSSSSSKSSTVSNSSSSQAVTPVASSSSSKAASSVASSASSSAASSSAGIAGPANFNWAPPTLRQNGSSLDITELGGYELRYRKVADSNFTYVTINDPWKNYHSFSWLEGSFVFQVAAFDKNGNYSNFVDIVPN